MTTPLSDRALRDQAHFDRIANQYFRKDLLPAHQLARQLRLRQTLASAPIPKDPAILEIGCGAGFTARYLEGHYARYVGVDYSEELISYARCLNNISTAEFVAGDANALSMDESFDVIVMIGLLHHLPDPVATLSNLKMTLKPGGWIMANEPQRANKLISMLRWGRKLVDSSYSSEQDEYSRADLFQMFERAGLEQVAVIPQGLFSTPFAEVVMPIQPVVTPLSRLACGADRLIEKKFLGVMYPLSWNLIAAGRLAC